MSPRKAPAIETQGLVDRDRLREALRLIREAGPQGISRKELAARMGAVSLRTVDRSVLLLEAQGARIAKPRKGWPAVLALVLEKGPSWDEHVSTEARLALRLAGLSLAQSGTLLWQDKLETMERLASEHMSTRDRQLFDNLKKAIHVQGGVEDPIEAADILEPLLRALDGPKVVEVQYLAAAAKQASTFTVVPYALTHDLFSGGSFLLVWDPARQLPLHLRLSRIEQVKLIGRAGSCPEALMLQAARYQIGGWTSAEPPFEITARIRGAHWIQAFREAPPALPDFQADPAADGTFTLVRFKASHPHGANRWLMQFGAAAEVLGPESLRRELGEQFRLAAAQYV
jgi:predicted DNA-binding transcriptional regulator YafY